MKRKILALGLFSLCCLALFVGESRAFFGLFHPASPWNRHNRYVTHITVRPYNAFTPIAWGNLVCDGCNPSPCGVASGQLPMTFGAPPWAGCGMPCYGPACGPQYSGASDMPMMHGPMMHTMPPGAPTFTAPPPMINGPMTPGTTMAYPPSGVSQANYHPMLMQQYPNYYMPTYYNPYQQWQPNPYYWYGSSR